MGFLHTRDMGTHPIEEKPRTIANVIAADRRMARYGTRYAQTTKQLEQGGELGRKVTGDSLEFRPNADRYERDEQGQYLLDLPK